MGDLNKYFSRWEFACTCGCGQAAVDVELLNVLTDAREHFNKKVIIRKNKDDKKSHAANRCLNRNRDLGASTDKSYHPKGMAADFHVEGVEHIDVYSYLHYKYPKKYGIICYSWGIHFDVGQGGNNANPRPYHKIK